MKIARIRVASGVEGFRPERVRKIVDSAKLSDLVPKYEKQLPKDFFIDDAELHYARRGEGYLLYSVGPNGKDDGGKGLDDRKNNEDWDDVTVRVPAVVPPKP